MPSARACPACHAGRASYVLGFSALQLSHPAQDGRELTLARLSAAGLLSHPPAQAPAFPGSDVTRAALGYLHANCGNCHSAARPVSADHVRPPAGLDLWVLTSLSQPEQTATYRTAFAEWIVPGKPDDSRLLQRMLSRSFMKRRMPPIASELADQDGSAAIARWIAQLRP